MSLTNLIATASLLLVLAPATQALASTPHDLGSFQTQCMAQGGTFGVADDADSYACDLSGEIKTCDFGGRKPSCVTVAGPEHRHLDVSDANDGPFQWTHRTYTPTPPLLDLQP